MNRNSKKTSKPRDAATADESSKRDRSATSVKVEVMPKEQTTKEPTISLEFLAQFIAALLGNIHIFSGVRSAGDVLIRFNEIVADSKQISAGVDRFESQMENAIALTSWLGAVASKFSNRSAEKRIHLMYAILRYVFFEAPWPTNPRIDPAQKNPTTEQNNNLIAMACDLLQGVPCVREAIEAQQTAGTFASWKIARREKSTREYSKLRNRLSRKVDELITYLSAKLLQAPDNTVKTSEKNSGAKNTDNLAPDAASGATNAGNLAPATRAKKGRKKPGV